MNEWKIENKCLARVNVIVVLQAIRWWWTGGVNGCGSPISFKQNNKYIAYKMVMIMILMMIWRKCFFFNWKNIQQENKTKKNVHFGEKLFIIVDADDIKWPMDYNEMHKWTMKIEERNNITDGPSRKTKWNGPWDKLNSNFNWKKGFFLSRTFSFSLSLYIWAMW